jgi:hypothetical protein
MMMTMMQKRRESLRQEISQRRVEGRNQNQRESLKERESSKVFFIALWKIKLVDIELIIKDGQDDLDLTLRHVSASFYAYGTFWISQVKSE